jgi:gelsolin
MTKVGTGAKLEDSNIALYGSKDHKDAKLNAAKTETAWNGAGQKVGVEVWRIEKFKVVRQEEGKNGYNYGSFFSGDAYIVLNTYKNPENQDKLLYNVHFWLGAESSQDEQGTAAYKTVELDDLLGDLPVQFREVQGSESDEFIKLFPKGIKLLKGGIDSGFNKVKPTEYKPRLLHVKGKGSNLKVQEVDTKVSSLNMGDVFILDLGLELIQWNGASASIHEKNKAKEILAALKTERNSKPTSRILDGLEKDNTFWKVLGRDAVPKPDEIAKATPDDIKIENKKILLELSDKTGSLVMKKVSEGHPKKTELNTEEVFILDTGATVYAWIGDKASKNERAGAIKYGTDYLVSSGKPLNTSVQRVLEGKETKAFLANFS